jgi:hypothetical protein
MGFVGQTSTPAADGDGSPIAVALSCSGTGLKRCYMEDRCDERNVAGSSIILSKTQEDL